MSIVRLLPNKNNSHKIINISITRDNRLSWKAKGIWLYALSCPDDRRFCIQDLINQSTDGRDSIRGGLAELERFGYLVREQKRDENGSYSKSDWTIYETPQSTKEIQIRNSLREVSND